MKSLFIHAKFIGGVDVKKALRLLPKRVGLVTTIQHLHELKGVKKAIEDSGRKAIIGGQILGCDVSAAKRIKDKVDAFLYVGSGEFHPIGVSLGTGKKVIVMNPSSGNVSVIKKEDVEKYKKKEKGSLIKFLSSKDIGILVSVKSGQENLKKAFELKKKLKNKECYIFAADTIDYNEFDNFPFIECWVNTACPRFADEKKGVVNYEVVEKNI